MSCPMTKANAEKYKLTDEQVTYFCDLGCSIECEKELKAFGERNLRRLSGKPSMINEDFEKAVREMVRSHE